MAYIDPILNKLGYELPESIKQNFVRLEHSYRDYVIFSRGLGQEAPLIVIEAKKYSIDIKLKNGFPDISDNLTKKAIDQSFNYAEQAGIPWILTSNGRQWLLFKTYIPGVDKYERVFLVIHSEEDLNNRWDEISSYIGLDVNLDIPKRFFALEEQLSDKVLTFALTEKSLDAITDTLKSMYKKLYTELKIINEELYKERANELNENELNHRACMTILHKILFINILESFKIQKNILSLWGIKNFSSLGFRRPIHTLINNVLDDFNIKFNGSLFKERYPLDVIIWDDKVLESIIIELDKIDYTMIDKDVMGDIYEHFLGEIVNEEKDENMRKILGQYYTPSYVVEYIVNNTVKNMLENFEGDLRNIKILDPACGSGSFLTRCYEILKEEYEKRNEIKRKEARIKGGIEAYTDEYDAINDPLKYNLYGIDINPDAIQLADLNLNLIKMINDKKLKYIEPNLIKDENKMFPLKNLYCGNTLITDENIAHDKAFIWEEIFPEVFMNDEREIGFDVIIGNPPYVSVENLILKERHYLMNTYNDVCIKRFDIFIPFIDKGISLLKDKGRLSFIVSVSFLSQDFGSEMRKKILENTIIEEIVDLRKFKIFPEAAVRNIIFKICKTKEKDNIKNNKIKIIIQNHHPSEIGGIKGLEYNTKQLTYLNLPEYMIRTELNDTSYKIVKKIDENCIKLGQVLCISWGARGVPVSEFHLDKPIKGYEHLFKKLLKGKNIKRYNSNYEGKWLLYDLEGEYKKLYRPAFPELFENNKLIIGKVTGSRGLIATIDEENYYTDDSLSCAIPKYVLENMKETFLNKRKINISSNDIEISRKYDLKYLLAIINSSAITYYFNILLGYELNVYPELLERLPVPIVKPIIQSEIVEKVDSLIILNKCQNIIENVYNNLLNKFGFINTVPLYYYYPRFPIEVGIDVINSVNYEEKDNISNIDITMSDNLVIKDNNGNILHEIHFNDEIMKQFFFLAIKKYIKNTRKRKFKDILELIEIPISVTNRDVNSERIRNLMDNLINWHKKSLNNELKECPIKVLNLSKFEEMINEIDMKIDSKIFNLFNLHEGDIEIINEMKKTLEK